MSAYAEIISVTGGSYPATPQLTLLFQAKSIAAALIGTTGGTDRIAVSFDGANDAVILVPGTPAASAGWESQNVTKVWLRVVSGVGGDVQIMAEQ